MSRAFSRRCTALGLGLAVLAGAASCSSGTKLNGEEKKTATEVRNDAAAALKAAKSVRVVGKGSQNGQDISFDLTLTGTTSSGSFTQGGEQAKIIKVDGATYLNASKGFYEKAGGSSSGATIGALVGGRWVKLTAADVAGFAQFTLSALADQLSMTTTTGSVTKTDLDGQKAVTFTSKSGSSGADTTNYVANTGAPRPLKSQQTGTNGGSFTFSDYDAAVTTTAPKDAVDESKLQSAQ